MRCSLNCCSVGQIGLIVSTSRRGLANDDDLTVEAVRSDYWPEYTSHSQFEKARRGGRFRPVTKTEPFTNQPLAGLDPLSLETHCVINCMLEVMLARSICCVVCQKETCSITA